jgi:apolipoprotein N-acyltransferase
MIIANLEGKQAFYASYFFSFFFNAFSLYWVAMVTPMGTLAAITIVAFYYTLALVVFNRLYRYKPIFGIVAMPFLWVGIEYFRTLSQFAFPWSDLGYSQAYYLVILQIVSVLSVHGLSFLIVTVNVLLWQVLRKTLSPERRLTAIFASVVIIVGLISYGWIVMPKYPEPGTMEVALLQGSIPLEEKWAPDNAQYTLDLYDSLARSVADTNIELYIWPETAVPCYLSHNLACQRAVGDIVEQTHAYNLVGALGGKVINGEPRHFNSCFQVDPNGRIDKRYDKVKLVPFSETVPYQDELPFLRRDVLMKYLTFIKTYDIQWWSDFYPGDSADIFELPNANYGVLICFESAFPEFAREMIHKGANFIVSITNDTWFGNSVGIYMHARIFLTRAVENRCWMARVANSGITYIVDPYGRIRERLGVFEVAALKGKIGMLSGYSFFTRHGDIVGRASFLILVVTTLILIALWFRQKLSRSRS